MLVPATKAFNKWAPPNNRDVIIMKALSFGIASLKFFLNSTSLIKGPIKAMLIIENIGISFTIERLRVSLVAISPTMERIKELLININSKASNQFFKPILKKDLKFFL